MPGTATKDDRIAPTILDTAKYLPQWFIAIFALIYLSGYLADFFYYSSIGISEAGSDALKLKHVQSGLFFFLIFFCVGGVSYLAVHARRDPNAKTFLGRNKLTYWVAIVFQSSVVLAVAFVPPSDFREWYVRLAFGALIFFNVIAYLSFIRRAERNTQTQELVHPAGAIGGSPKLSEEERKHRIELAADRFALLMILVIAICDAWIFGGSLLEFGKRFFAETSSQAENALGPLLFLTFSIAFFQTLGRLIERMGRLTHDREDMQYTIAMGFMLLGLFYLSLSAYAYTIMPYVPSSRGGASFCDAPLVTVSPNISEGIAHNTRSTDTFGIVVYTTSDTIYIAETPDRRDGCHWKGKLDFPDIVSFPKTDIFTRIIAKDNEH